MNKYDHLIGLSFEHGTRDCYSCFKSYYKDVLGVQLSEYARPNEWWLNGMDLYRENFEKEGFKQIDMTSVKDIQLHDGLLISIPDPRLKDGVHVPNHIAVYVGNGKILHHRYGKLSTEEQYRGMMRNCTTMIIRHKDVKIIKDKGPVEGVDLMDRILPHKRQLLEAAKRNAKDS